MGLPLMSRCSCVAEVSDESVLDDVWYAFDEGLNAVVVLH
jgi:hypothetical protein